MIAGLNNSGWSSPRNTACVPAENPAPASFSPRSASSQDVRPACALFAAASAVSAAASSLLRGGDGFLARAQFLAAGVERGLPGGDLRADGGGAFLGLGAGGFEPGDLGGEHFPAHLARLLLLGEPGQFGADPARVRRSASAAARLAALERVFRLDAFCPRLAHQCVLLPQARLPGCEQRGDLARFRRRRPGVPLPARRDVPRAPANSVGVAFLQRRALGGALAVEFLPALGGAQAVAAFLRRRRGRPASARRGLPARRGLRRVALRPSASSRFGGGLRGAGAFEFGVGVGEVAFQAGRIVRGRDACRADAGRRKAPGAGAPWRPDAGASRAGVSPRAITSVSRARLASVCSSLRVASRRWLLYLVMPGGLLEHGAAVLGPRGEDQVDACPAP